MTLSTPSVRRDGGSREESLATGAAAVVRLRFPARNVPALQPRLKLEQMLSPLLG
jgi:hypothetical protein